MSDKAYEQAIGFLRITDGDNVLDATAIHPESYEVALKLLSELGFSKSDIGTKELIEKLKMFEEFDVESVAVTDGPRLVEPLKELGYTHVVAELDAHSKTLGTDEIVFSDFGGMIRSAIGWLDE